MISIRFRIKGQQIERELHSSSLFLVTLLEAYGHSCQRPFFLKPCSHFTVTLRHCQGSIGTEIVGAIGKDLDFISSVVALIRRSPRSKRFGHHGKTIHNRLCPFCVHLLWTVMDCAGCLQPGVLITSRYD